VTTTLTPPMRVARARLGRYAVWHLYDYMRDKGIATVITVGLIGYLNQVPLTRARAFGVTGSLADQLADQAFVGSMRYLVFLGVLFATNGLVADDRRFGYYRLLFAKPVNVVMYYGTKFLVYGAGFLVIAAALLGLYTAAVEPFFPPAFLPTVALIYVALGGIGFLLSATFRFDWLSLAVVIGGSEVLWLLFRESGGWRASLLNLLPPVHLLDGVYQAVRAERALPAGDLVWLVAYGVACFAIGLWVVRRRPLAGA
jgi:hypothetical protein